MNEKFVRDRITQLRMEKNLSEYQLSLELGQNKNYIQGITSGKTLPSLGAFFKLCDYFEITPAEFFIEMPSSSVLVQKAAYEMRILSDADIIAIISIIRQLQEKYR